MTMFYSRTTVAAVYSPVPFTPPQAQSVSTSAGTDNTVGTVIGVVFGVIGFILILCLFTCCCGACRMRPVPEDLEKGSITVSLPSRDDPPCRTPRNLGTQTLRFETTEDIEEMVPEGFADVGRPPMVHLPGRSGGPYVGGFPRPAIFVSPPKDSPFISPQSPSTIYSGSDSSGTIGCNPRSPSPPNPPQPNMSSRSHMRPTMVRPITRQPTNCVDKDTFGDAIEALVEDQQDLRCQTRQGLQQERNQRRIDSFRSEMRDKDLRRELREVKEKQRSLEQDHRDAIIRPPPTDALPIIVNNHNNCNHSPSKCGCRGGDGVGSGPPGSPGPHLIIPSPPTFPTSPTISGTGSTSTGPSLPPISPTTSTGSSSSSPTFSTAPQEISRQATGRRPSIEWPTSRIPHSSPPPMAREWYSPPQGTARGPRGPRIPPTEKRSHWGKGIFSPRGGIIPEIIKPGDAPSPRAGSPTRFHMPGRQNDGNFGGSRPRRPYEDDTPQMPPFETDDIPRRGSFERAPQRPHIGRRGSLNRDGFGSRVRIRPNRPPPGFNRGPQVRFAGPGEDGEDGIRASDAYMGRRGGGVGFNGDIHSGLGSPSMDAFRGARGARSEPRRSDFPGDFDPDTVGRMGGRRRTSSTVVETPWPDMYMGDGRSRNLGGMRHMDPTDESESDRAARKARRGREGSGASGVGRDGRYQYRRFDDT